MAERLGAEIVSVDSMLVYRGMDVGTAKPTAEQRARVPHHLIDLAEPSEAFSGRAVPGLARGRLAEIDGRGRGALLVGGSGLYFRAVVDELEFPGTDPARATSWNGRPRRSGPSGCTERWPTSTRPPPRRSSRPTSGGPSAPWRWPPSPGDRSAPSRPAWERYDPARGAVGGHPA